MIDGISCLSPNPTGTRTPQQRPTGRTFAEVDKLVTDHITFAKYHANRRMAMGEDFDQAFSDAMVGLLHAAKTWVDGGGDAFMTWAWACIRSKLHKRREATQAAKRGGGALTLSLDAPLTAEDACTLQTFLVADTPGPVEEACQTELVETMRALIDGLTTRERDIIFRRFGFVKDPEPLHVIGPDYGVSRERIRVFQNRALDKLRARYLRVADRPESTARKRKGTSSLSL